MWNVFMFINVQGGQNEESQRPTKEYVVLRIYFGPYNTYLKYDRPIQSH